MTLPLPRRIVCLAAAALVSATLCSGAAAQSDPQAAEARKAFEAGMSAMNKGDLARARELLQSSMKLVAKANTVFNLADCEEQLGLLATALKRFEEGLGLLPPNDDRRPKFNERIAALEAKAPRLRVDLAEGAPAGTRVLLSGEELSADRLGVEMRVDPGHYRITVKAPARADKVYSIDLVAGQKEALSAATGEPLATGNEGRALRIGGFVAAGVGVAGLGVWAGTGLAALEKKSRLDRLCGDLTQCVIEGKPLAREGATLATASTVALVVGLVGVGAGATLLVLGRRAPSVSVQAAVGPGGGMLGVRGDF